MKNGWKNSGLHGLTNMTGTDLDFYGLEYAVPGSNAQSTWIINLRGEKFNDPQ